MSNRSSRRNNLVAGTFLIAGLLAAMTVSFILSDLGSKLGSYERYTVRFSLADGVPGLEPGAVVRVGGRPAGSVESIDFAYEDRDGRSVPVGLDVMIRVPSKVSIYDDAVAYLDIPLLGAGSTINLPSVGGDSAGAGWLTEGGQLRGTLAPPGVLAQSGYGEAQKAQVQAMIRDASETAAAVRGWTDTYGPRIEPALAGVEQGIDGFRSFADWLDGNTQGWGGRVDAILEDVEGASAELQPAIATLRDDARAGLEDARTAIASIQAILDENRPTIAQTVTNAEELTARLRDESAPRLDEMLERASGSAAQFEELGGRATMVFEEQVPNFQRVMANLRLTSDQMKLAVGEIRSQPWRLLTQPKTRELEQQLLLDAARSYAVAASDLRAASEQLDSVLTRLPNGLSDGLSGGQSGGNRIDPADIVRLREGLYDAFGKYQDAERLLIEQFTALENE